MDGRIRTALEALEQAAESSTNDTKSSAGDKFETGREMAQQEIGRHQQLLEEARRQKSVLLALENVSVDQQVIPGSLVLTDQGGFYLSIGAGMIEQEGNAFYAISAVSPMGKILLGKKAGEFVLLNNRQFKVLTIL